MGRALFKSIGVPDKAFERFTDYIEQSFTCHIGGPKVETFDFPPCGDTHTSLDSVVESGFEIAASDSYIGSNV